MNHRVTTLLVLCFVALFGASSVQAQVTIKADVTTNTLWTSNNTYLLDGLIFVNEGATLTIEPGTVIKGLEQGSITTGDGASALIVRRGAKIHAEGTAAAPIVFTSELDDVANPTDLTQRDRGLWGGVILLGKATTNQPTTDNQIEGIDILTDPALYGGTDDNDNSGVLKYVSIRHGGFSISGVEGDEINGLTMGAVGAGTTIDFVEVYANFDDCYEWFGGTVNTKHLVGAFCGDDTFDYDQGFRGKGQFWFSIQDTDVAGRAGEHDGGDGVEDASPFSIPVISNVTYIGSGHALAVAPGGDGNDAVLKIRDNAGAKYWNSIFTEFRNKSVDIEDLSAGEDSRARLDAGDIAFVNKTIEPGTVIKGLEQGSITTGDGASALIVRRGAKIHAEGTAAAPIVFTSELDDVANPTDLTQRDRGLWGGVILLGKATTNQPTTDNQIEGIDILTDPALYGGTDDDDNSGVLKYVSIRHGGFSISGVEGDEINGLTMGAVGRGTTIDFVEVYANFDDCYEWFGGTVNTKHLVGAFCGDDTFDYDQGFRGKGQFWFSIQDTDVAGRAGEHDGGDGVEDASPFSIPVISNVTYIGSGHALAVAPGGDGNDAVLKIRDNAGAKYWNSIFTEFRNKSVDIEDLSAGEDSRARLDAGDIAFVNNMFWNVGAANDFTTASSFASAVLATNNGFTNPSLAGVCRTATACLDPRPNAGSPALSGAAPISDSFFDNVAYRGAFGEALWLETWTALAANNNLGYISSVDVEEVSAELPLTVELSQNYPNPFNPSTSIEFKVNAAQHVRLSVFDVLGREVENLVNGVQPTGSYRVTFDATGLTSGMYLYRLEANGNVITKSMMLLK